MSQRERRTLDFTKIGETLDGLVINVERDLRRRVESASVKEEAEGLILLRLLVLYSTNGYDAVRYLCGDFPPDPNRRAKYAFATPPITRALLDCYFTVLYIVEDFPARALAFHKAGWREQFEELQRYKSEYGNSETWTGFIGGMSKVVDWGRTTFRLAADEQKDPKKVPYWPTPNQMRDRFSATNRPFARWLDDWFYRETSALAHVSFLGLSKFGATFLSDMLSEDQRKYLEAEDSPKVFKSRQVSLILIILLAMASELEARFALNNMSQISRLWGVLRGYLRDADEICKRRFDALLQLR